MASRQLGVFGPDPLRSACPDLPRTARWRFSSVPLVGQGLGLGQKLDSTEGFGCGSPQRCPRSFQRAEPHLGGAECSRYRCRCTGSPVTFSSQTGARPGAHQVDSARPWVSSAAVSCAGLQGSRRCGALPSFTPTATLDRAFPAGPFFHTKQQLPVGWTWLSCGTRLPFRVNPRLNLELGGLWTQIAVIHLGNKASTKLPFSVQPLLDH